MVAAFALILLAAAPETLTVALRPDNHAAPLYAACRYEQEFARRYGLSLRPVEPGFRYDLYDGRTRTLVLRLAPQPTDADVIGALATGRADVGLVAQELVQLGVISGWPLRIIAPLQHGGELLVAGPGLGITAWTAFAAEAARRPLTVGFIGPEPAAAFALEQALDFAGLKHSRREGDTVAVRLVELAGPGPLASALAAGAVDAAALRGPAPGPVVCELGELPPDRFYRAPGTVVAATSAGIARRAAAIRRFLELLGVATHYANNCTRNTITATSAWLGHERAAESLSLERIGFSSLPDLEFGDGIWNWYFALRLSGRLTGPLAGYPERDAWLGVPYDSTLLWPALERAGARIIR